MAPDDDHPDPTGPEPAENERARDGEPTAGDGGSVHDLRSRIDAERAKLEGGDGLSDRTAAGEPDPKTEEEDDGQFAFVVEEQGKQVRFSDLIKRNTPVEFRYKLAGKGIPNVKGGLIDPYQTSHLLIADCVVDSAPPQYIRDGQGRVEKVIITVIVKPRVVQQAFSEAGRVMLEEGAKAANIPLRILTGEDADAA